jgi:Clp amino terminal domain, pathogenicity island component
VAVYAEHFLLGVLAIDGPGQRLLVERFGVDLDDARAWVAAARPKGRVPRGGPTFDPSTRAVLDRAAESATTLGDAQVTSAHLVAGVLGASGLGATFLRERGVDAPALHRALAGASDSLSRAGSSAGVTPAPAPASDSLSQAETVGREAGAVPPTAPSHASDSLSRAEAPGSEAAPAPVAAPTDVSDSLSRTERHFVLALAGSAEAWTAQLDGVAANGWTLVAVVPLGAEVRAVFRRHY